MVLLGLNIQNDTIRLMHVVGLVLDQSMAGDFTALPRGYVSMDSMDWLGQPQQFNRLYATVSANPGDEKRLEEISEAIEDKIEKSGRTVYRTSVTETDEHPLNSTILALLGILGALGVLVLFLSSSLIVNTLNALLSQHLRQIGVMKLVGGRSIQISTMYVLLILAYSLIALVISVPLGALAGYGLSAFMADFLSANLQGFRLIPIAIVLQVAIAFIVPLAAGYVPVNRGSKITVRRAISNDGTSDQAANSPFMENLGRWLRWLSRPLILSIRNTFRRKGRLALTLFTLAMAGAIFIAVFNVQASLEQFVDDLGQHFMADVTLNLERPYRTAKVEQAALQVPGITEVEGWLAAAGEIVDENDNVEEKLQIIGPPAGSKLLEPDMVSGRWLQPGDEKSIALSDTIWDEYPDLQPGDTLRLTVQGGRSEDWTVIGIFRFISLLGVTLAYTDYDTLADVLNMPDQSFSYRLVTDAQSMENQVAISNKLDQFMLAQGFKVSNVEAGLVSREEYGQGLNIVVIFLLTMAILTAFVGSIGLAGTLGMNVMERTREIGVMRAIGAADLDILKTVVIEGMMIGLISWILAIFLSFPISYLLRTIVGQAMINRAMPAAYTIQGFAIWLVLVLALAVMSSILPARSASRLTIREVLAYE